MIIMANVLLKPKVAVAIDMPITPYIATGLHPYRSDAYVHGTTMRDMRGRVRDNRKERTGHHVEYREHRLDGPRVEPNPFR